MKDYDEYLKKKLAKIKKDGIMILDPLTGKERFHLANAAKRTGCVSTFTIGEDKRVVLRYKPKYEEFIDSKKMLEEAKEAYRDKDYEKSIKTYRVLLALGAPKAFVFAGLGLGYYHLNKKRLASSYLLVATELSKQNNEEFDFAQMIETLNEDYTDLEEKKSSVKVDEDEFKSSADDYYGKEAFVKLHDFLVNGEDLGREFTMGMGGFVLKNTLSDNGTVTRGVSVVDENGLLSQVHETTGIEMGEDGEIKCDDPKVQEWISPEDKVSMNMWAGYPEFIDYLAEDFKDFLANVKEGDLKSEYLLPNIVDKLLKEKRANVKVLETQDRWFGVTYKEDKEIVQKAFAELIQNGVYAERLWK